MRGGYCMAISVDQIEIILNTFFQDSINVVNDYSKRLELFKKGSRIRRVVSVWKPRDEFHLGQYSCLLALSDIVDCGIDVEIVIGQDKKDEMNLELKNAFTKAFIREMSTTEISETIQIRTLNNYTHYPKDDYFSSFKNHIYNNGEHDLVEQFNKRSWSENKQFTNSLLNILKYYIDIYNDNNIFIVSGQKHLDIWENIASFMNRDKLLIIPLYLKDILSKESSSMSFRNPEDKIFLSLNQTSRSKIEDWTKKFLYLTLEQRQREINNEIYQRIISQVIIPSLPNNKKTEFDNLAPKNLESYITDILSERIKKWVNIKKIILFNQEKIRINNSFLIRYLQKEYPIKIPEKLTLESKSLNLIDEKPEEFRQEYQELMKEFYKFFANGSSFNKIINLQTLVESSSNIDIFSYLTENWHRDHYLHQFNVASLGEFFFATYINNDERLIDAISMDESKKNEIHLAWWTAALLHDHAYPIEKIFRLIDSLKHLEHVYDISDFSSGLLSLVEDTGIIADCFHDIFSKFKENTEIKEDDYNDLKYLSNKAFTFLEIETLNFDRYNHAHLGVVNIFSKLGLTKNKRNLKDICPDWLYKALRAIALHHHCSSFEKINFIDEPIAFMLIFCDEMQEWTRRQLKNKCNQNDFTHSINATSLELIRKFGDYTFPKVLEVCFESNSVNDLCQINWDYIHFLTEKEKIAKFLSFWLDNSTNHPLSMQFSINIASN